MKDPTRRCTGNGTFLDEHYQLSKETKKQRLPVIYKVGLKLWQESLQLKNRIKRRDLVWF